MQFKYTHRGGPASQTGGSSNTGRQSGVERVMDRWVQREADRYHIRVESANTCGSADSVS